MTPIDTGVGKIIIYVATSDEMYTLVASPECASSEIIDFETVASQNSVEFRSQPSKIQFKTGGKF